MLQRLIILLILIPFQMLASDSTRLESDFFQSIRANQVDSYITFGQGFGNLEPLIFEGLVAPYFLLRTRKDARWGATVSPAIMIRMKAEESFPVYSPSYLPNITLYHQLSEKNGEVKYLFATLRHHSNGQFNNFYNQDGSLNTKTGDFSTNMVEFGAFFNKPVIPFSNTKEYFRTSIEYHIDYRRSEELQGIYSFVRWHNSFRIFKFPLPKSTLDRLGYKPTPRVQTNVETTWMFGDVNNASFFDLKERFNLSFTISYRPKVLNDVSLFVRFYSGKDYYNMQFLHRINVLSFGIQAYTIR